VQERNGGDITWFQFAQFGQFADFITHGIFARNGGVSETPYATLNAGLSSGDDPQSVEENRVRIMAQLTENPPLVTAHPVHGTDVVEITPVLPLTERFGAQALATRADGMITQMRGVGLFWAYADCTPVLIVDPPHKAIALAHAGWRGTSGAVAVETLREMREHYSTRPGDVWVGLGPSIGPCCYEVDEPVREAFLAHPIACEHLYFSTVLVPDGKCGMRPSLRLDVEAANRAQLIAAGVPDEQIESSGFCTGCRRDLFFSHRLENSRTGRHAVVIGLH
jgi:polyphenol oxidase